LQFPPELVIEIEARLDDAKRLYPGALSKDRKALLVDGGIGYGCYVAPDGDIFMETYDAGSDEPSTFDRSRRAQIAVLVLGSRTIPKLSELLPTRPADALPCAKCTGTGWLNPDWLQRVGGRGIFCDECSGLGWVASS